MSDIIVCYATGEGQTAKVAEHIADHLAARGHATTTANVTTDDPHLDTTDYDAVIVGASIHAGTHQDAVRDFVTANRDSLDGRPTAFFQVSLSSVSDDPERQADAARYVDEFLEATDWHPDTTGLFGGALRYSTYGFLKRLMMKQIAKEATGDTDTSRDYEYTDWAAVEMFADDVAALVEDPIDDAPVTAPATRTDTAPEA